MMHAGRAELRRRLRVATPAEPVRGTFVKLADGHSVDVLAGCGLDVVVIDQEHSELSEGQVLQLVRRCGLLGQPALVRLGQVDATWIGRLLDAGATGIQLAGVERRSTVDALLDAVVLPPRGRRGVSLATALADHGALRLDEFVRREHEAPPVTVIQLESLAALARAGELHQGVDAVFVGTTDLAVSTRSDRAAISRWIDQLDREVGARVPVGGFVDAAGSTPGLERFVFRLVESDLQLLASALRARFAGSGAPG